MMSQDTTNAGLDLHKVMQSVARMNPHISLSDIAFLMDVPYEPEPCEFKNFDTAENFKPDC